MLKLFGVPLWTPIIPEDARDEMRTVQAQFRSSEEMADHLWKMRRERDHHEVEAYLDLRDEATKSTGKYPCLVGDARRSMAWPLKQEAAGPILVASRDR